MSRPFQPNFRKPRRSVLDEARALEIATDAFVYLAQDGEQISRLLAQTGLAPSDLRQRSSDREFLVFVLDYMMADESLLLAFAANTQQAPETIAAAAQILSGPPPHDAF